MTQADAPATVFMLDCIHALVKGEELSPEQTALMDDKDQVWAQVASGLINGFASVVGVYGEVGLLAPPVDARDWAFQRLRVWLTEQRDLPMLPPSASPGNN